MTVRLRPDQNRSHGFGHRLATTCKAVAAAGGLVLLAITLMTVISVTGRTLFNHPLPGDFELVEVGCAVAVFAFLPYCQFYRGNVIVDFFTARAPAKVHHLLGALGDLLYLLIALLLTWRLAHGALDFLDYGEQTMVLRLPLWWSFGLILPSCALLVVVCGYTAWDHLRRVGA